MLSWGGRNGAVVVMRRVDVDVEGAWRAAMQNGCVRRVSIQNSKSSENCSCLGIPALSGVSNEGRGDLNAP